MVKELEEKLKVYLNVPNIIATTNGTLPLQLAIKALKLTGEKETDPVSYKSIRRVYELVCPTGMITSRIQNNSYPIELRNVQKSPIKCNN